MNSSIHCGLQGQYKVDIFSGKTLVSTTDWFSNNITNTGMLYPYTYPFARCFMYLSLGTGTFTPPLSGYSLMGEGGTTPIMNFRSNSTSTIHTGQYIGYGAYETGSACGTLFTPYGIDMFRGWKIPSGDGDTLKDNLDIGCFMVSPSHRNDTTGKYAFSLVNQTVNIPAGFNATIYYKLSLRFPEYFAKWTQFRGTTSNDCGYFDTGSASFGQDGPDGVDGKLVAGWKNLSGIYRQIFPGLQFVDNKGGCVTTKYGSEMEPSVENCEHLHFYLSPDIAQFSTSIYGTGSFSQNSTESGAYNSCGLAANYSEFINCIRDNVPENVATTYLSVIDNITVSDPDSFYYSGDDKAESSFGKTKDPSNTNGVQLNLFPESPYDVPINHHLSNVKNISGYQTSVTNFKYNNNSFVNAVAQTVNYATPGASGWSDFWPKYGQPAVFSTSLRRMPITRPTSRNQGVTKFARIAPIQAFGYNARYGTMTLAFMQGGLTNVNSVTSHPYMEYLFFDTSGRAANCPHYRIIPEIYLAERGSGVAGVVFSITGAGIDGGTGSPVQRIWNATGFMGPYNATNDSGINPNYAWTGYIAGGSEFTSGILWSGSNVPSTTTVGLATGSASGTYGIGAVYGMVTSNTGFYGKPYDVCLLDNPVWSGFSGQNGMGSEPVSTGEAQLLCWPYPGARIGLAITGMKYYHPNWLNVFNDVNDIVGSGILSVSGTTGAGGTSNLANGTHTFAGGQLVVAGGKITSSFTGTATAIYSNVLNGSGCVPTSWKKPSGNIHHLEFFSGSGYRLLPNYGSGNIGFDDRETNVYQPIRGGQFPGLSMENGMELYFDFRWSG